MALHYHRQLVSKCNTSVVKAVSTKTVRTAADFVKAIGSSATKYCVIVSKNRQTKRVALLV